MKKNPPAGSPSKRQLRDLLEKTRQRLFASISRLTEEQMYRRVRQGQPCIAEVLAHLPPSERAMRAWAEVLARGEEGTVAFPSPEQEREWGRLADRMVPPQIVNDLVGARWQTLRFLDSLPARDLRRRGKTADGTATVAGIIERIATHEGQHVEEILRLRRALEPASASAEPQGMGKP